MAAKELAIQRRGEKFWSSRLWVCKGRELQRRWEVFLEKHVIGEDEGRLC
jgi:hypothetical protein